jgi:hypothetical protein
MKESEIKSLVPLDYPPLTDDLELAKQHLDQYGIALIKDVISQKEVCDIKQRLEEQFYGEEKHKVGSKVRGDERYGVDIHEDQKVSRLVWNLINKGDFYNL